MSKKSRKPNLPQETLERARRELERGGEIAARPTPAPKAPTTASAAAAAPRPAVVQRPTATYIADLAHDYRYVLTDLRNMAVLASIMMVLLVALSFVI